MHARLGSSSHKSKTSNTYGLFRLAFASIATAQATLL
jgi:hypothetical protein